MKKKFLTLAAFTFAAPFALAQNVSVTNTFSSGQPAVAAEVNQNFQDLVNGINSNGAQITTNTSSINNNASAITANGNGITNNANAIQSNTAAISAIDTSGVSTNANNITNNTNAISANDTDIANNTAAIQTNAAAIAGIDTSGIQTNANGINSNSSSITTNSNDIANNNIAIQANTNDINSLDSRVTTLETATNPTSTTVDVDCSSDSINTAITNAPSEGKLTINVIGNCTETVLIERDNVSLVGSGAGATITYNGQLLIDNAFSSLTGVINVIGSTNIAINNIDISGGDQGLNIIHGSSVAITDSIIESNFDGVSVRFHSNIRLSDTIIQNNTRSGLFVTDQANVELSDNVTITHSSFDSVSGNSWGVLLGRNSNLLQSGTGSSITNNSVGGSNPRAIEIFQLGSFRSQSGGLTVSGDIGVFTSSLVEFRSVSHTGDSRVGPTGVLRLRNNGNAITLTGTVTIDALGKVLGSGLSTIDGDVNCPGNALSYFQNTPTVTGTLDSNCTTF